MSKIGWRFPPLSGGNKQGYTNSGIETFKGEELIDNLAREICQNSLDAKDESIAEPVIVKFEMKKFHKKDFDVFCGYEECLKGCKKYWGNDMDTKLAKFVESANLTLENDDIFVLTVGDYNTTGLTGVRSISAKTAWSALTCSDGVCVKPGDTSGGSYGIGKNAPFACSSLSMVFYNTYTIDGDKAFKGVSRLATILDEAESPTQGVGHYQNNNDNEWLPIFENDACDFRDEFKRTKYGTDIIIVGFNEEENWINQVEKAVIKNFFLALHENKLVVEIQDDKIDSSTLIEKIQNKYKDDKEIQITGQLFEAILNPDNRKSLSIIESDDAEVYIKSDRNYGRTIANFRTTGMLVGKYARRIFQHYAAVLIIRGKELDVLLKDTEPARHNRWDYKLIDKNDKEKRIKAKDCIYELEKSILDLLKNQYEVVTEQSVDSDTSEYLADEIDDFGEAVSGDDILKAKQTITKVRTRERKPEVKHIPGRSDTGDEEKGDINNETTNPNPNPPPSPPRPVHPQVDNDVEGVAPENGTKVITTPNITRKKTYLLDEKHGLYKLILIAESDYDNIYVKFSAVGEDESTEFLNVEYFTDNGVKSKKTTQNIGPITLKKDVVKEIVVCFEVKEQMGLYLSITEENCDETI